MTRRARVFGAIRWAGAATVIRALLQFGQIVLLARYLQKEDMGLAVLVFSFIAFAQVFTDFGLSNIIMHKDDLDKESLGAIFGFAMLLGVGLWLLSCLGSPFAATFYGDERLVVLLSAASSVFFLNSLWMQHKTIAEKAYNFGGVAIAEIVSGVAAFAIFVTFLLYFRSVYSAIVFSVSYSALMAFFIPICCRSSMIWSFCFSKLKPHLRYSMYNLGFSITNSLVSQADVFFGSRVIGYSSLGGYGVSKDLGLKIAMVVNNTVARVAAPLISESRGEKDDLRRVYAKILSLTTFVNFPIYMTMAIFGRSYVSLLFGDRWLDDWGVFSILGVWGLFRSVGNPCGSLLFVLGQTRLAFRFSALSALVFIPFFGLGAMFGPLGLAFSMLLTMFFQQIFPIWRFIVGPLSGISYSDYLLCIARPFASALFAAGAAFAAMYYGFADFILAQLLVIVLYVFFSFLLNRDSLEEALRFLGFARFLRND